MLASLQEGVRRLPRPGAGNTRQLAAHKAALHGYAREQAGAAQELDVLPPMIAGLATQWQAQSASLQVPEEQLARRMVRRTARRQ